MTDSARNTTVVLDLPLAWIKPSRSNPRRRFDEAALAELAESIRAHGLLEPIVVRELAESSLTEKRYELIAGERRWRAAQLVGLTEIPARVLDADAPTALRLQLVENLQREDLDPIEEAEGFRQLNQVLGLKQREIAEAVKRSQPAVANRLRLLELPADVQERIRTGELSPAHGIAIAKFKDFPAVASKIAEIAVQYRYTSGRLEQEKLPSAWQLEQEKVVRQLRYDVAFDVKVCEQCPFGAYRSDGTSHRWCLNPQHYDELQSRGLAERKAETQRQIDAALTSGRNIARLRELPGGTFERISEFFKPPVGCSEACPCRAQVLDGHDELVSICTDPKRLRKMEADAKRAEGKAKKAAAEVDLKSLRTAVDELVEIGPREMALIALMALKGRGAPPVRAALRRHLGEEIAKANVTHWDFRFHRFAEFAAFAPLALAKAAFESILADELYQVQQMGNRAETRWSDWYLGRAPQEPPKVLAPGQEDDPLAIIEMQRRAEDLHEEIAALRPDLADLLADQQATIEDLESALAALREGKPVTLPGVPTCRVCGCTDDYGCDEGCEWVEADLCSSCGGVAP